MQYTVTVFGLGFVGLTTALAFAEKGNKVFGFDVDRERASMIKSGKIPFAEPELDGALLRHINKNFFVIDDRENAVESTIKGSAENAAGNTAGSTAECISKNAVKSAARNSDFIFLCVGTPCKENGEADLRYIYSSLDILLPVLGDTKDGRYRVVAVKSTIPPSTTSEKIIPYLKEKGLPVGKTFGVANNPEFLREGCCWNDMINADRIVCGVSDERSEGMLKSLYSSFNAPFFAVSLNTGEFIKYLSNTLLATMISYSNEMSVIAHCIGDIQIKEAFSILHLDKRWGNCGMKSYVYPGCGYGGYCLPKDTQAMYVKSLEKGYEPMILKNVIEVNNGMPQFMANKIVKIADKKDKIGILGLSFKPGSDDVRDSSSAKILRILLSQGYNNLAAYDPAANDMFSKTYNFSGIVYYNNLEELYEKSDVIVLITAWEEFKGINKKYPGKKIVDCRYYLG